MLRKLARLLGNFPLKSIFITLIIVGLLAAGVINIYMATGNDTLVKTDTKVYQDNEMLEKEFGGESVIVLYESDDLLTPENLKHIKGIEDALKTNDSIYSMMSPVTLVEEIASKQSDEFRDGIGEIIDGLDEMGTKLIEIGDELKANANRDSDMTFPEMGGLELPEMEDPELPEMGKELQKMKGAESSEFGGLELPDFGMMELPALKFPKMDDIDVNDMDKRMKESDKVFSNLTEVQEKLGEGTQGLVEEYDKFGAQLGNVGESLLMMADQMADDSQKNKLFETSQKLLGLSRKMLHVADEIEELPDIPDKTVQALGNVQGNSNNAPGKQMVKKQQEMQEGQKAQREDMQRETKENREEQTSMLRELGKSLTTMGENLQEINENMLRIEGYSDIMTPGLPDKQATLDNMLYVDGELRTMFKEVVVDDNHMMMMITFNGDTDDDEKSNVVDTIRTYLNGEQLDSLKTIVSGKPVLDNGIRSSMQDSIQKMMGLALLLMVIVLFFVFKVRWFLLPLLIVLVAVIGTVGLMGWFQIPITMVSMAVFPILIGLGIDYAIQFQNRYAEEMAEEDLNE